MLIIKFETSNAAFQPPEPTGSAWETGYYRNEEIKRVLKNICNQLDNGIVGGACMDINGNKVGDWVIN